MYHKPVMLHESVEGLQVQAGGLYADVTFGGGGHARAILDKIGDGHLFGFDQDRDALANVIDDRRFTFIPHNFQFLKNFIRINGVDKLDGIFADLGVSSHQFDIPEKGFSTRFEGKLDMRMDQNSASSAADIVNSYDQEQLTAVFRKYGELPNAWTIAGHIVSYRQNNPLLTTTDLKLAIEKSLPRHREFKVLAQVFQALRIEVNAELKVLEIFLEQCAGLLKPGGRLVVISYHSLEDRLVKNFMRAGRADGQIEKDFYGQPQTPYELVSRKPITPSSHEIAENSRSRSAKLRIAQRKDNG
ncbi:MAG: 16S rRNA (cytosine(1402)-N(4))-methyltransferase RsmH [Bacteroidetes bacterium]|nr:16S rRNA (cytosine(1402)-N(4))-methyltransferase RsmH [Bacteroidota bacterium]MBU1580613.1 16S rRNA (cytosine(1402)-N(4))-methyltransferase RsmH [Bacteroidota bacterium]MBU2466450.1 16S rRNA (cytosine(1402)-N(4))-methyltransferase RsmH [Bacteroidota bacterium]MBU2557655.1 16S rRNA (cytosine(1402)-N(4))-methyltransferase RsmH [Bacteroidota bacterium]